MISKTWIHALQTDTHKIMHTTKEMEKDSLDQVYATICSANSIPAYERAVNYSKQNTHIITQYICKQNVIKNMIEYFSDDIDPSSHECKTHCT